mmetsp:Transcript_38515/g.34080  ORF Transcript_38515/g.34080 Transcript_38515/m.34080 type:complete len:121 (+) Transcript_38515:277-639(+)
MFRKRFVQCKRRKGLSYKCFDGCDNCPDPSCVYEPFEAMNPQCLIDEVEDEDEEQDEAILANVNANSPSTTSSLDIKLFGAIAAVLVIFGALFVYYKRRNNNDNKIQYSPVDTYGTSQTA